MEKYLYPTLRLMQAPTRRGGHDDGILQQGMGPPKNRTEYDLEILRNTVSSSGIYFETQYPQAEMISRISCETVQTPLMASHLSSRKPLRSWRRSALVPTFTNLQIWSRERSTPNKPRSTPVSSSTKIKSLLTTTLSNCRKNEPLCCRI
jgi:hypothetical protein